MNELLSSLNSGVSVTIETDQLPDFWEYCKSQDNLYAFNYEYFKNMVKIIPNKENTVIIIKSHDNQNQT